MTIAVFDTYVTRPDGRVMHFDILVPDAGRNLEQVLEFGRRYLAAKDLPAQILRTEACRFCHVEQASAAVQQAVDRDGFAILELGNCD